MEEKNKNGIFKNIFIKDDSKIFKSLDSEENTSNLTIFAQRAKLLDSEDSILILENGTIHSENKDGEIKAIDFQKTRFSMRQKQIITAKKTGKKHIFQKEYF